MSKPAGSIAEKANKEGKTAKGLAAHPQVPASAISPLHEAAYPATQDDYAPGCTCFYLRSATRRVTQVYDDELKSCGISVNQYSLLSRLSRRGGISVSAFAEHMSMDRTTLTRNLAPLEAAGWIASGATAGRARLLSLTEAGEAKLREAFPLWETAQAKVNAQLGGERQRGLHKLLKESIRSFEQVTA